MMNDTMVVADYSTVSCMVYDVRCIKYGMWCVAAVYSAWCMVAAYGLWRVVCVVCCVAHCVIVCGVWFVLYCSGIWCSYDALMWRVKMFNL